MMKFAVVALLIALTNLAFGFSVGYIPLSWVGIGITLMGGVFAAAFLTLLEV